MNVKQFRELHLHLSISLPKSVEVNLLPSDTDPTQDVPIKMIEVNSLGVPINVKQLKAEFSNVPADKLTAIEKRFNDKFDVLGELQNSIGKISRKGVNTNFIKPKHEQKKHES